MGGGGADALLADRLGELEGVLLDRAVGQHHHHERGRGRDAHELDRADRRVAGGGPDHDAGVGGEVAEEPGRVLQHLLELAVGLLEERAHLHGVLPAEAGGLPEVVDEEAVALLGGDPAGAGVGLAEVALLLEGGHVVAHGGRRHRHRGRLHDVRRPHRLGGVDVLLHDGPEDGGLAFVEHAAFLALDATECQPSAAGPRAWQPGRMRFVVVGAGAVGGVVGGRLAQHDHDVVLVARGDHGAGHRRRRAAHPVARRRGPGAGAGGVAPVRAHAHRRRRRAPGGEGPGHRRPRSRALAGGPAGPGDRVPAERRGQRAPGAAPHAEHLRGAGDAARAPTSSPAWSRRRRRRSPGSSTSAATRRGIDERAEAISTAFATSTFSSRPAARRDAVQVVEAADEPRQRARGGGRADRPRERAVRDGARRGRGRARGGRHRLRVDRRRTPSGAAT